MKTLFREYAEHRAGDRGSEETGWVLLGVREADEALVLATLPAGADRDAGEAHVRFNSTAQGVASRIVRQTDRRLTMLGVVHTHPGSLRHPSDGDYRGDIRWVGQLRGGEGVFGIGTADPQAEVAGLEQPRTNVLTWAGLQTTWYSLRTGMRTYQPIPVVVESGPDLAQSLRDVWPVLEVHADRLDLLARQLAKMICDPSGDTLTVTVPLADANRAIRVLLARDQVRYLLVTDGSVLAADLAEPRIDRGVYRLLTELAAAD